MTHKISLECDQCHITEAISKGDLLGIQTDKIKELVNLLPGDWRRVSIDFGNQGGKAAGTVCSFKCAVVWMNTQLGTTVRNAELQGVYINV